MDRKSMIFTGIALLFHISGAIGLQTSYRSWFLDFTPLTLMLMTVLVIMSSAYKNNTFLIFALFTCVTGFFAEWIGVNTGLLFGNYTYGETFGYKWGQVPLLIGLLWFVTVYSGILLTKRLEIYLNAEWSVFIKTILGATLITAYDFVLEPAAVQLGFWSWEGGTIPLYNYISWWLVSAFIIFMSEKYFPVESKHLFPVVLLFIQVLFYVINY